MFLHISLSGALDCINNQKLTVGPFVLIAETNNQAHRAWTAENPDDEDPPYTHVACDVAIQTVRPKTVEVVMNLEVGKEEGNREPSPTAPSWKHG